VKTTTNDRRAFSLAQETITQPGNKPRLMAVNPFLLSH